MCMYNTGMANKYISRAGEKLEAALNEFNVDPKGLVCADFGCNAGGFTDCLLQKGAARVYAVDTGYEMLDWKLRNDARVIVLERTNSLHVKLGELCNLICLDLGWTTQTKALPNTLLNLKPQGMIISLLKPHYEAKTFGIKLTNGKLTGQQAQTVANKVIEQIKGLGLKIEGCMPSPLTGRHAGNSEYLLLIKK